MTHTSALHKPKGAARVAAPWEGCFPTAEMVGAAVSLFTGHRLPEGMAWSMRASALKSRELFPEKYASGTREHTEARQALEGPVWRVLVSPGSVAVRYSDPVRSDRMVERAALADQRAGAAAQRLAIADGLSGPAVVAEWSRKSRSRMVETIQQLDWSPLLGTGAPLMVTLTYPGDWLAVAPHAAAARRHIDAFKRRYRHAWGAPISGVWKREFQARGAPHYHILLVPPAGESRPGGPAGGLPFDLWLSHTWASVVGAVSCGADLHDWSHVQGRRVWCCERGAHHSAGTGIDAPAGRQMTDPRKIAAYFAKHGSFAAKEYQNQAPPEWRDAGSVGRFWGVWGIAKCVDGVFVHPAEGLAAARTLRRMSRANAPLVRVPMWRYTTVVDPLTGEVTARWRKSSKRRRLYHVKNGRSGFLAVDNGPAVAAGLARHLDRLRRPEVVVGRAGGRPLGFLP